MDPKDVAFCVLVISGIVLLCGFADRLAATEPPRRRHYTTGAATSRKTFPPQPAPTYYSQTEQKEDYEGR